MEYRLEAENALVLDALQASIGLISVNVRAVSVQLEADRVVLHFAVREHSGNVDEDIEEMIFELDALRDGSTKIEALVYVGAPDKRWPGRAGRLLYLAKEAAPDS